MGYSAPRFGIISTGFVKKLTSDIELDLGGQLRANLDPNVDLSPTEPLGQIVSAVADSCAQIWEALDLLYAANDPGAAEDKLLDNLASITGTRRGGATYSKVVVNCDVNDGTTVPVGTQANVSGQTTNLWQLVGVGNNVITYTPGPLVAAVHGTYSTVWQAMTKGPNVANAGTLTVVPSPPTGLNSITNAADAIIGALVESDTDLRIKREEEIQASGSSTIDAIRASLLEVPGVIQAYVYENTGDVADAFGRPAHSIEAVIWDGVTPAASNTVIAQTLWDNKPGGIPYYSATGDSGTATDSLGTPRVVSFSRAAVVQVYLAYTVKTGSGWDGTSGPIAIKAAAAAYALENLQLGSTVNALELRAVPLGPLSKYAVHGIIDVTALALDTHATPTATANLVMTSRQFPFVQTTHVTVTVT